MKLPNTVLAFLASFAVAAASDLVVSTDTQYENDFEEKEGDRHLLGTKKSSVRAKGDFTVAVDFATLSLTPVDENCLLTVEGEAIFSGTLEGIATGRTRALALASCADVSKLPPGSYEDVFTSALEFAGKVDGQPVVADITYRGNTAIGGEIEAKFILSNGLQGRLSVEAIVAVGGSYEGQLRIEH